MKWRKKLEIHMKSFIVMDIAEIWGEILSVVCCQVEVSATGWSLVRRSPTDCGGVWIWSWSLDNESSWPTRGCCVVEKKMSYWMWHRGNGYIGRTSRRKLCLLGVEFCLFHPNMRPAGFSETSVNINRITRHHTTQHVHAVHIDWLMFIIYQINAQIII